MQYDANLAEIGPAYAMEEERNMLEGASSEGLQDWENRRIQEWEKQRQAYHFADGYHDRHCQVPSYPSVPARALKDHGSRESPNGDSINASMGSPALPTDADSIPIN